ncbi:hypothetical protein BTJ68_08576 [Hortaea werneckii EXF-2000]|uniref:Myb-like domain-containing protein n=2 Tax=Hortaea werneckii TaxID=91943 RepID=A0A3M7J4I1_HORWE|nr:hypothetical protein BTJ68_08576 [Hortaea werneckii EXF-2000]RMZ32620.1 hypothetical protein D0859_03235 [Hortaea werneckii]
MEFVPGRLLRGFRATPTCWRPRTALPSARPIAFAWHAHCSTNASKHVHDNDIIRLRKEGKTRYEIAETLRIKSSYVDDRLYKHLVPQGLLTSGARRVWSDEEDKELLRCMNAGLSASEIYARFPERSCRSVHHRRRYLSGTVDRSSQHSRKAWSAAEQDKLVYLHDHERLPWDKIAERMGRSVASVSLRYFKSVPESDRVRLPRVDQVTEERLDEVVRLRGLGHSFLFIAKVLGMNPSSIWQAYWTNTKSPGFKSARRAYTPAEDEAIVKHRETGMRWREMTAYFPGRSEMSLRQRFITLNRSPASAQQSSGPPEGEGVSR